MNLLSEIKTHGKEVKLRYHIEFQYSESLSFFDLFKRYGTRADLAIERCSEVAAVQYQDFLR